MAEKPEKQLSTETQDLIRETVSELFKQLAPVLQSVALTPEKLREAQKPYEDPMDIARQNHEQEAWRRQEREKEANKQSLQEHCPHTDNNGKWNISLQHNYHDHLTRGICNVCGIFIHPAYWDYRPETDPITNAVRDKAFIVPQHKLYHIVQQLDVRS